MHKILIDQGSLINVLFWHTFKKMDILANLIQPYLEPLPGFSRERVHTKGYIDLLTTFRTLEAHRNVMVWYLMVKVDTSYNILIGWRMLNKLEVVVSIL